MKPILVLWCALALAVTASAAKRPKPASTLYDSYSGFTIPAEPVLPAKEVHPSLWFRADELPALTARLSADEFCRTRLAALKKLSNLSRPLPAPPEATDKTESIHKYYGTSSAAARINAFLSLVSTTEAERAAHRQRALELLLRAYDGPIFDLDSNVKGSPVDEIYRGSWLQNYAHAYDCIQPSLTAADDEAIRARLVREARCVYENLYRWTSRSPHNHLSKPAWGLGTMALTLSSHPEARAWLARALEASNKNTRYFFSGDGIYREGSHYLIFSLTNFLPFLYHYRNVSGVDGFPAFQPVFEAMVEARNSRGWLPNIEDSYIRPTPTHLAAAAYRTARTRLHSTAPLAEILTWSYTTCDLSPFEQERKGTGFNYTGASFDYPLELDELLTHDPTLRATPPDIAPTVFLDGGQSYFRDSWTSHGDGQRYLLFHGVAVADNHNHDDQLSFIIEAEDQMMCSDSGYSRGSYWTDDRAGWYATAPAHNTLTFDGLAAADSAPNVTPPSSLRTAGPGLVGEEKTAFFGPAATWSRAIFWIADDYYVVADRVTAKKSGKISSYLHGGRGTLATHGAERTWTYDNDRYGRAATLRTWLAAPGATITEKEGELTYIKGDYAAYPYLQLDASAEKVAWLTLLKPARPGATAAFQVEDVSTAEYSAFQITAADHRCLVATQREPGAKMKIGDVTTDGAFVLVRRDLTGRLLGFTVLHGTSLAVGEREIWHSAQRKNVAATPRLP